MYSSSIMSTLVRRSLRLTRASSSRLVATRQLFHSSSFPLGTKLTSASRPSYSLLHSVRFASSSSADATVKLSADDRLSKVIESEIQCAEEVENDDLDQLTMGMPIAIRLTNPVSKGGIVPDGFPFEIIDTPGEETITLKRQFDGETIEVLVHMPQMAGEENENDDDDDKDDKEDENSDHFDMPMIVTVTKGDGPSLEFGCTATPNDITIDSMLMRGTGVSSEEPAYEGPEFTDLDEELQAEFHKYLERRGIKSSYTDFLQEYMVNKDNKEYVKWLKNMKEFVEK